MSLGISISAVVETDVFDANYTHNVTPMAALAGVYDCLWRAEEHGIVTARQLIEPLEKGIADMRARPAAYEALNPKNGWGSYQTFLPWLERLLAACREHPDGKVWTSR